MKRVEIIYGGASNEKEISHLTAKSIYEHINTDLYNPGLTDLSEFDPDNFDKTKFLSNENLFIENASQQQALKNSRYYKRRVLIA